MSMKQNVLPTAAAAATATAASLKLLCRKAAVKHLLKCKATVVLAVIARD
jgi:hypothetical protein